MMELTSAKGKRYVETILEGMMYYPTIFPSQEKVAEHLFLGYGTGYAWNKEGQLAYYLGDADRKMRRGKKRVPARTKESILGEHKEGDRYCNHCKFEEGKDNWICFHGAHSGPCLYTHDIAKEYSPIMFVLRGEVTPAKDWKEGLEHFCHDVLRPDLESYKMYFEGHVRLTYNASWKDWFPRMWDNYLELRKICRELLDKWYPKQKEQTPEEIEARKKQIALDIAKKLVEKERAEKEASAKSAPVAPKPYKLRKARKNDTQEKFAGEPCPKCKSNNYLIKWVPIKLAASSPTWNHWFHCPDCHFEKAPDNSGMAHCGNP